MNRETEKSCILTYLAKFWLDKLGLKLQVEDDKLRGGKSVGEFLLVWFVVKISAASFGIGLIESGERATLPGVMLGSSSMFFICEPCVSNIVVIFSEFN